MSCDTIYRFSGFTVINTQTLYEGVIVGKNVPTDIKS
jgi:hypothetical protein